MKATLTATWGGRPAAKTIRARRLGPGRPARQLAVICLLALALVSGLAVTSPATAAEAERAANQLVLDRALTFAGMLSPEQREQLIQPYSLANAARWHNQPEWSLGARGRLGLRLDSLSPTQIEALDAMLQAATGPDRNEGFDELQQHLLIDDFLHENRNPRYGRGDFLVAFLGTPSDRGLWQLQFGGQHFALSHTYSDGALVGATPSFRGVSTADPVQYRGADLQPQRQEMDAFLALLASLDEAQEDRARLPRDFRDILMGAGNDWIFPDRPEGLAASRMNDMQQDLLRNVIALYVADIDPANAAAIMARYDGELDRTRFSFSGSGGLELAGDYVRIDGPSVWIELVMDTPYNFPGPHPHSVWRDRAQDYGGTGRP